MRARSFGSLGVNHCTVAVRHATGGAGVRTGGIDPVHPHKSATRHTQT
jgi:hypothetical protein